MLPLDYHRTILVISLQRMNGNFHGREVNQKANKIAEPKKPVTFDFDSHRLLAQNILK